MSAVPRLDADDFRGFFHAVHGAEPFPWQERLLREVIDAGWPKILDLPTGTGKTAALDIAVFALALDAERTPRSMPLRIIYVVDRRTIVDQAYTRAKAIEQALIRQGDDVLQRVHGRLARYSAERKPLQAALLRGGIARDETWARTPDQPLIVVSTVDQVGSRLLFRGYGVSDSMKPVHAGLVGCDALYLLDEVHLSQPFRETVSAIEMHHRKRAERPLGDPFVVVEMSATPGRAVNNAFQLDDADRKNSVLSERLTSSKPAALIESNGKSFAKEIEQRAVQMLQRPGATIAVVVNRVNSARHLHGLLRECVPTGSDGVHLLTGRMRSFDRDELEQGLLHRIRAGRTRRADDRRVVIVATQSIEAGADFDFDGLLTECASLDALRQRFGRLDRLGHLRGAAEAAIIARTDALRDDPIYGDAIDHTWQWLKAQTNDDVIDFGIERLSIPQDAADRGLLSPRLHAPILLPSHLDLLVQTSPMPAPNPDVGLWLHGPERGAADVQVIWRADLSQELLERGVGNEGASEEADDRALEIIEALPPVSAEAMPVPFAAAKRWLEGRPEPDTFDVEGAADRSDEDDSPSAAERAAVLWQGDQSRTIRASQLRPGQTIVVPASYGGVAFHNWAPASIEPVVDVGEIASWRQRRRPALRCHPAVLQRFIGGDVDAPVPSAQESEAVDDEALVRDWLSRAKDSVQDPRFRDLLNHLHHDAEKRALRIERLSLIGDVEGREYFVLTGKRRPAAASDEPDAADERSTSDAAMSSFTGVEVTLRNHLRGVAETLRASTERIGIPNDIVSDLESAGGWHDAGKADPRFQIWLHAGSEFKAQVQPEPLAKSRGRISSRIALRRARERAGYPAGTRHEVMSVALMMSAADTLSATIRDWNFVLHVVASHHGFCRPLAPWVRDNVPVNVTYNNGVSFVASSAHELARLDSGVAERFWKVVRTYGWWGSAWLEAMLRLADHRQSEQEQMR